MNAKKHLVAILSFAVIATGCSATGPIFEDAKAPSAGCGLVYIYRPDSFIFSARDAYFYVNDANVADVSNDGYSFFYLPAGAYQFKQKWPIDLSTKTIESTLKLGTGETHYIRLNTSTGQGQFIWVLSHLDTSTARPEIAKLHYQEAKRDSLAKLGVSVCN